MAPRHPRHHKALLANPEVAAKTAQLTEQQGIVDFIHGKPSVNKQYNDKDALIAMRGWRKGREEAPGLSGDIQAMDKAADDFGIASGVNRLPIYAIAYRENDEGDIGAVGKSAPNKHGHQHAVSFGLMQIAPETAVDLLQDPKVAKAVKAQADAFEAGSQIQIAYNGALDIAAKHKPHAKLSPVQKSTISNLLITPQFNSYIGVAYAEQMRKQFGNSKFLKGTGIDAITMTRIAYISPAAATKIAGAARDGKLDMDMGALLHGKKYGARIGEADAIIANNKMGGTVGDYLTRTLEKTKAFLTVTQYGQTFTAIHTAQAAAQQAAALASAAGQKGAAANTTPMPESLLPNTFASPAPVQPLPRLDKLRVEAALIVNDTQRKGAGPFGLALPPFGHKFVHTNADGSKTKVARQFKGEETAAMRVMKAEAAIAKAAADQSPKGAARLAKAENQEGKALKQLETAENKLSGRLPSYAAPT